MRETRRFSHELHGLAIISRNPTLYSRCPAVVQRVSSRVQSMSPRVYPTGMFGPVRYTTVYPTGMFGTVRYTTGNNVCTDWARLYGRGQTVRTGPDCTVWYVTARLYGLVRHGKTVRQGQPGTHCTAGNSTPRTVRLGTA